MRHDGGANDAHGERDRRSIFELRNGRVECRSRPVHRGDEYLDQITEADDRCQGTDDQLDRSEASSLEHQNSVGHDRGDYHAPEEREVEQERKSDRTAGELREIGRHRRDLADHPHGKDERPLCPGRKSSPPRW